MLKNYFKIGWRKLLRNKGYSFINIGGLSIGIACFLLIIHYVRFERSYENFHTNADNIFRVTLDLYKGTEYVTSDCETNAPFGPLAKETMPEVAGYVRMMSNDAQRVKIGTKKFFEERSLYADPSVFKIFSFKILQGDHQNPLAAPYQVVLTAKAARKYFGQNAAIGESIEFDGSLYKVTAIMEDVPVNTHLKFDFLLSHATVPKFWQGYSDEAWNTGNNEYTYLLMRPQTDVGNFNKKLADLSRSLKSKIGDDRFVAQPIKDIHLYSNKTFEPDVNGNAKTVYFLLMIGGFIIVLAWVNYVNLSTAKAMERAREVGVRKVMGSLRSQLVFQFLSESIIINLLAFLVALLLIRLGLPFFRELSGQPLPGNLFTDTIFWQVAISVVVIGILLSGLYPAIALSSFEPVKVLKGKFQSSAHGQWLRKGLVVFQFTATATLIICLGIVYLQIKHLRKQDLGMNIEQTLSIRVSDIDMPYESYLSKYHSFKTELLRNPSIQMVTRSSSVPGQSLSEISTTNNVYRLGKDQKGGSYNYYHYPIDADFIPTFNMKLVAGRNFQGDVKNDRSVIINEEAARTLGFATAEEAIGEKITYSGGTTVIGVVKNFRQRSAKEKHVPMIFSYGDGANFFSIKMKTGRTQETVGIIKDIWNEVFPSATFISFFLDDKYNQQYKADAQFGQVIGTFSLLAILIACLGLFGLSSFTILQRTKEIGIRKVLGSSVGGIVQLLSKDFVKLVLLAGLLAMPLAYLAMNEWLSGYAIRIAMNPWIFVIPLASIVIISLLTIGVQTIKAAQANPVNSLRTE